MDRENDLEKAPPKWYIPLIDTSVEGGVNKPEKPAEPTTAKLFMNGRSQAVRLPKAFRFDGTEVRIRKEGDKVILEPIEKQAFDVEAMWARIDAILDGEEFLPEGVPDRPKFEDEEDLGFD